MKQSLLGSPAILEQEIAEEVRQSNDTVIAVSSLLNHVLTTQTIVGLEFEKQLESIDEQPDVWMVSVGSGSHLYGFIALPYF